MMIMVMIFFTEALQSLRRRCRPFGLPDDLPASYDDDFDDDYGDDFFFAAALKDSTPMQQCCCTPKAPPRHIAKLAGRCIASPEALQSLRRNVSVVAAVAKIAACGCPAACGWPAVSEGPSSASASALPGMPERVH